MHPIAGPPPAPPSIETPSQAAERTLSAVEITPRRAVLAATIRQLAAALESCETTDKAKTSRELMARVNEFLNDAPPEGEGPCDWTADD